MNENADILAQLPELQDTGKYAFIFWDAKSPKSLSEEGTRNSLSLLRRKEEGQQKNHLPLLLPGNKRQIMHVAQTSIAYKRLNYFRLSVTTSTF